MEECDQCGKVFARRANFLAHIRQHADPSFPCHYCQHTFGTWVDLRTHLSQQHLQLDGYGAGAAQYGGADHADTYSLVQTSQSNMPRFGTTKTEYRFNLIRDIPPDVDMVEALGGILDDMLEHVTRDARPHDLIQVSLLHHAIDFPIIAPMKTKEALDASAILDTVEKVQQSNQSFQLDVGLQVSVTHIRTPVERTA